jgi:hypothetical protein
MSTALSAKGETITDTKASVISAGEAVCSDRESGSAQSSVISTSGANGTLIVTTAEKDLCPQYVPRVLLKLSGSGIQNSAPFAVPSGTVTVTYTYNCANDGGTGNFIADLTDGSDDQSIANALGAGGTVTTTAYPADQGAAYHLEVNSECTWTVSVSSG